MNRALGRLIAGQICLHSCMAGLRLAAPLMALRQGYSEVAVGMLLALFALTQVFLALPAGRYADRHGLRQPVAWAVVAACSGALAAALWPLYAVLCASALLAGGATGVATIALQRHVGRAAASPTQLKQVFSWLSIGPAVANFIGPFSAGLVIDHFGFRAAFALLSALPVATWFWVRGTQEPALLQARAQAQTARAWDLWREPVFRRLILVNWLLSSSWDVHTFVIPVLGNARGFSASVIGGILGAFAVAAAAVRLLLPVMARHLRESVVITCAMAATALLFCVYPFLHTAWLMGLCSVLLGLSLGSVQPMVMSTLHQITPTHRHGEALGLRLMTINASSVLMPLLMGAAGTLVGVSVVFWLVGAALGSGARLAWGIGSGGPGFQGAGPDKP